MEWQGVCVLTPDRSLPILAEVEVCVVVGGAAGVAAAETAARHGRSVLVVERYGFCGGNAVAGMSGTICGMYLSSERQVNQPEQVVFGFTERFRAAMAARGGARDGPVFRRRSGLSRDRGCAGTGPAEPGRSSARCVNFRYRRVTAIAQQ